VTVHVDALDDADGLRVRDTAEGEQFPLYADRALDPTPASTDPFTMPVDAAVAVEARELRLPVFTNVIFWQDGEVVHRADSAETADPLPRGTYEVDFSPPGAKVYVYVEDATVTPGFGDNRAAIHTESPTRMVVGVRSHHETPAGTVTTTEDPRDLMAAVSTFGSALKTHSPDRSWPTLRGHPPAIRRGDELDVPEEVAPPETGVRIEVPPEHGAIYTVSPLAYYLAASVEPGTRPRVIADGQSFDLDADDLAGSVRSVLEHVFTLDCVVRMAGVYPFRTATADRIEERVDLDYEQLFELSLAERTAAYMDVPRSATDGLLDWHYTADVAADPAYAAALPYLVDELALVRSPAQQSGHVDLTPSPNALRDADTGDGALARSAASTSTEPNTFVVPAEAGTPGQSWLADGHAVGAANPTVGSFRRGFAWPDGDGELDVHVVYNDARLRQGDPSLYDSHPFRETNIRVSHGLSVTELREALYEEVDFLHFVGHVTDDGMVCPDGTLDTRTLAKTGVKAFFLNGCRSYEQGRALLTAGSIGGVVTVDDVMDEAAETAGETFATLLGAGFPLYAILDVLGRTGTRMDRYTILGDGTFAARQSQTGAVLLHSLDTAEIAGATGAWPITIRHYPYGLEGIGSIVSYSHTDTPADVYSASVRETTLPEAARGALFDESNILLLVDGEVHFTDDLSVEQFR
jgi:hypothetical protein